MNNLIDALIKHGYQKDGDWYIKDNLKIRFNLKSITIKAGKQTYLYYSNPKKITVKFLSELITMSNE